MSFVVGYSEWAPDDLTRLYEGLLDWVATIEDLDLAEHALGAILVRWNPSAAPLQLPERRPGILPARVVPFGRSGCVALFEIEDAGTVRDQLEDDYH